MAMYVTCIPIDTRGQKNLTGRGSTTATGARAAFGVLLLPHGKSHLHGAAGGPAPRGYDGDGVSSAAEP